MVTVKLHELVNYSADVHFRRSFRVSAEFFTDTARNENLLEI